MKWLKENHLPIILVTLLAIFVFKFMESKRENGRLHEDLIGKTQDIQFLNNSVANLERQYVKQEELLEQAKKEFEVYKKDSNKRIKLLSNATFLIRERARKSGNSDIEYRGKRLKYVVNEIRYNDGPAVGYVLIFDDGRVVSKLYNHEIDVKTLVARDEATGKYDVVTRADYVLKSPSIQNRWLNKPYALKIKGGTALIDPTEPINMDKRFYWWAPSINVGMNFYTNDVLPSAGFSMAGYGYTKRDLDFKFINLGLQYDNDVRGLGVTAQPVLWRPFSDTFQNTYFGPGVYFDQTGQGYYLGLQIGL